MKSFFVSSRSSTPEVLSHEDNVRARVDLWEQVKVLREQVEAYRQAGHELLSTEEQQALDSVQCTRVLPTLTSSLKVKCVFKVKRFLGEFSI